MRRVVRRLRARRPVPGLDLRDRTFIFFGGLHKSGTSILHRLMRAHPSTSGFSGTGVPQDEGQHLQTVYPSGAAFGGSGRFAFDPRSYLSEKSELVTDDHRRRLSGELGAYYDLGKAVLLEKSPPNLVRARFLQAMFPRSHFVFIIRHPVAVALATQKWSNTSVLELVLHWHVAHKVMFEDLASLRSCAVFRYEDFVQTPQRYLDRICSQVELQRFQPVEQVVDCNERYFGLLRELHGAERALLQRSFPEVCRLAAQLGYSFSEPFVTDLEGDGFVRSEDIAPRGAGRVEEDR